MKMNTTKNNYINYHYYNANNNKPIILFLHGLGGTGYAFRKYFTILKNNKISYLSTDHPFHGKTKIDSIEEYIDWLITVINNKHKGKVIIVAHCYGAEIAKQIVLTNRLKIKKVLLFNPLIDTNNQSKGFLKLIYHCNYILNTLAILRWLPKLHHYPDYASIGNKPYIVYWLNDMTHVNIKKYIELQKNLRYIAFNNDKWINGSHIILGNKDTITNTKSTINLIMKMQTNTLILEGNHLLPLINFNKIEKIFINFLNN